MFEKFDLERCIESDQVRLTVQVGERMDQRGTTTYELFSLLERGKITEKYPDDETFPSCPVEGKTQRRGAKFLCGVFAHS